MTSIYSDGEYLKNNESWHTEDSVWKAHQIAGIIDRNDISFRSMVEVGCGAGAILNALAFRYDDEKNSFEGYDISPQAIAMAEENHDPRVRYSLGDPLASTGREPFDVLLMIDVFEHVPDYMGFIERAKARAGYKIFHIPLELNVSSILRKSFLRSRESIGHLHYFTAESALATLVDTGHEIVDYEFTSGAIDLFRTHPSVRKAIANGPRWLLSKISEPLASRLFGGFSLLVLTK
jgi:SAM-dependent methyltransferase